MSILKFMADVSESIISGLVTAVGLVFVVIVLTSPFWATALGFWIGNLIIGK